MALPRVAFTEDSAGGVECAMALARLIISGDLAEEAYADPVGTHMILARTISWGLSMLNNSPDVMAQLDPQAQQAVLSLQQSLGINAEALGGSGVFINLILPQLMAIASKFVEEWLRRRTAGG